MQNSRWPNTIRKEVRYIRVRGGKEHTYKTVRSLVRSMSEDAAEFIYLKARRRAYEHDSETAFEVTKRRERIWQDRRDSYHARYRRRVTKLLAQHGIKD